MNKAFLFLIFCQLTQFHVQAQLKSGKVEVTWGEGQNVSRKIIFDDIIGSDESGIYVIKKLFKGNSPVLIERYNHEMVLEKSLPIKIGENKNERSYEFGTQIDGNLLLFTTFLDRKSKTKLLFMQHLDATTLKPTGKLTQVGTIDYSIGSKIKSGSFTCQTSDDEKRILIYYSLPTKKGENKKFFYHMYDSSLNLIWEKKIALTYQEELIDIIDLEITKDGDLLLLSRVFQNEATHITRGKPNYHYQISTYSNNGNSVKQFPLILGDLFITDMKIVLNDLGELICGGFYSESGTLNIDGSYFLKINLESNEIIFENVKEFGLDVITQNMTDKQKEKVKRREARGKDEEYFQYDLKDIILLENGGAILIGEQYFFRIAKYKDSQGNLRTTYHYFYNDIIVISINAQGQIAWTERIAKRQHTINDGGFYSSFSLAIVNDQLNFVFNDNIKNLIPRKAMIGKAKGAVYVFSRNSKTSTAALVQIDSDGRQVREALFNAKETEVLIRPEVSEQVSNREIVVYGRNGSSEHFGLIKFK